MRLYLLALLGLLANPAFAQLSEMRIEGKPTRLEREIVAVRDANGRYCAAVQVHTNLEGLAYDSFNGVVKVQRQPGRETVYLSPDERVLEVLKRGYSPLKIILSEVGMDLRPGEVWMLRIVGPRYAPSTERGKFVLITQPSDATFEVDGLPIQGTTPYYSDEFNAQPYRIWIRKDKYEPQDVIVQVRPDSTIRRVVRLKPKFGLVSIQGESESFDLYVNGVRRDFSTNQPLEVPLGKVKLSCRKKYFKDYDVEIDVTPNDNPSEAILIEPEFERIRAKLRITSNVEGADVFLNDRYQGRTPLEAEVIAGKYNLRLVKQDYRPESRQVEILSDQPRTLHFDLSRMAIVSFEGTAGAKVEIDGVQRGTSPLRKLRLEPGKYDVVISKEGYDTKRTSIKLKAEEKTFNYNLAKSAGRFVRLTAFGNKRIAQIFDGFRMSIGYAQFPLASRGGCLVSHARVLPRIRSKPGRDERKRTLSCKSVLPPVCVI